MHRSLGLWLFLAPLASAQFAPAPFLVGGEHQLDSDLDGGGRLSRSTARVRASAPVFRTDETIVGLSLGYQFDSFEFAGLATDPWSEIHRLRLGLVVKSDFHDRWSWMALPWVGANAESGADWGESLTVGGIGGAWYEFSDRLSLGLGLGLSGKLEDDLSAFPILFLDWKLTDCLTLSTVPPEGFQVGPGVSLRWDVKEDLSLALIYQYQSEQQRLDRNSLASAHGIGELRQSRVALAATYRLDDRFSITANAGVGFGGELELQDATGSFLSERDFDPSLVVGLAGSLRF